MDHMDDWMWRGAFKVKQRGRIDHCKLQRAAQLTIREGLCRELHCVCLNLMMIYTNLHGENLHLAAQILSLTRTTGQNNENCESRPKWELYCNKQGEHCHSRGVSKSCNHTRKINQVVLYPFQQSIQKKYMKS